MSEKPERIKVLSSLTADMAARVISQVNREQPGVETVIVVAIRDRESKDFTLRAACFSDYQDQDMIDLAMETMHLGAGVFAGVIETQEGPYVAHIKPKDMN